MLAVLIGFVVAAFTAGCERPAQPRLPAWRVQALVASVRLVRLEAAALTWHQVQRSFGAPQGLRLLYDAPVPGRLAFAVVRSIVRANPRLDPVDALLLGTHAIGTARRAGLEPHFFCAVLLQESAFSPGALSAAGAVGIAQFTLATAADEGVDPFDWADAMRGSADLLARYVRSYEGGAVDPYATALAAYDAGPGNVAYYHGIPPFAETRTYIADVYDRWSRLVRDETGAGYLAR